MPGPSPDPTVEPRLLDAADALIARHGYRAMTIAAVAAEARVGKGSVYLHFPSKQALALACIDRMADQVQARLAALAEAPRSAPERLRAMLRSRVLLRFDYARRQAASLDALLAEVRPHLLARRAAHFASEAAILAPVLVAGAQAGTLRRVPAPEAARALVSATNDLLPYSLSSAELGQRAALARRVDVLADLLLRGLLPSNDVPLSRRTTRRST